MIPVCRPYFGPSALDCLKECLDSGWLGYGPACHALEERFTTRGGWALATSSCTSALYLAGRLCRRQIGDEVIVPALTFVSTAMAFKAAGLQVRVADVDPESLLLSTKAVKAMLSPRTVAVVAVHLYGQHCRLEELRTLCNLHGLTLIEDAAHRLDLLDPLPPLGDLVCYSFNAVKEAPCGEGGLLWGRDISFAPRARSLSNLGMSVDTWERSSKLQHRDYCFDVEVGLKLRLNDVNATLVLGGLDRLSETRKMRAALYNELVKDIVERVAYLRPLDRDAEDSYLMCVLRVTKGLREAFRARLAGHRVATSVHYPSLSRHPLFATPRPQCAAAESADRELVTIPCYPGISDHATEAVLEAMYSASTLLEVES